MRATVFDMAREFDTTLKEKYQMDDDERQRHVSDFMDELLDELHSNG